MHPRFLLFPLTFVLLLSACTPSEKPLPTPTVPAPRPTSTRLPVLTTPETRPDETPGPEATPPTLLSPRPEMPGEANATPDAERTEGDGTIPATSERLVAPRLDVHPGALNTGPAYGADELMQRMMEVVADDPDTYAFYVKDMRTGRTVFHNADRVFYSASMFKLWVMLEVYWQESLGLFGWDDELIITPYYDTFGLSPRETKLCQVITVREAVRYMMTYSDNAAAVLLQDLVGAPNINATLESLGLVGSQVTEDLPLMAIDLGLMFEAMAKGELISPEASQSMIYVLTHDIFDNGASEGLPEDVAFARKTGNWSNAVHEGGIVFEPKGPYVLVLLSEGGSRPVLTELSRVAWEYFEGS